MATQIMILDSWGLVAFFEDEQPAAGHLEKILIKAQGADMDLLISAVNLGEVWYSLARAYSDKKADQVIEEIGSLGIQTGPADWEIAHEAAIFKVQGNVAFADCFALALAKMYDTEVVTGDPEFKQFEKLVSIHWLT